MSGAGTTELPDAGGTAHPAALWRRVLARAADSATVLLVLWMLVVLQVLWFMRDATHRYDPEPWGRAFVPLTAFILLSAIYEVVFLCYNEGQTPGKDLFNVRVVRRADDPGLSLGRAALRWLLPGILLFTWPWWLGQVAVAATGVSTPFGQRRRALHDLIVGTEVIHHRREDDEDDDELDEDPDAEDTSSRTIVTELLFGRTRRRPRRVAGRAPRRRPGRVESPPRDRQRSSSNGR